MTFPEFDQIQKELLDKVLHMANTKGKEYANGEDRFANFKEIGASIGIAPEKVLWIYVAKHIRSVESYIKNGQVFSNEPIEGRILDIIVYMTLLHGLIEEKVPGRVVEFFGSDKYTQYINPDGSIYNEEKFFNDPPEDDGGPF